MSETVAVPRELLEMIIKKMESVEDRINKLYKMLGKDFLVNSLQ